MPSQNTMLIFINTIYNKDAHHQCVRKLVPMPSANNKYLFLHYSELIRSKKFRLLAD